MKAYDTLLSIKSKTFSGNEPLIVSRRTDGVTEVSFLNGLVKEGNAWIHKKGVGENFDSACENLLEQLKGKAVTFSGLETTIDAEF